MFFFRKEWSLSNNTVTLWNSKVCICCLFHRELSATLFWKLFQKTAKEMASLISNEFDWQAFSREGLEPFKSVCVPVTYALLFHIYFKNKPIFMLLGRTKGKEEKTCTYVLLFIRCETLKPYLVSGWKTAPGEKNNSKTKQKLSTLFIQPGYNLWWSVLLLIHT